MKPSTFNYEAPDSLERALELLAEHGDDAKVLAGGQSLIPLLNLRLARPSLLVDINRITSLGTLTRSAAGLHIGALTRQVSLERSPLIATHFPLLAEATKWVAHPQIRTRGTVGGSAAHADAGAELPATLCALEATFDCRSVGGSRTIRWSEFFLGQYESALRPDELLIGINVPFPAAGTGVGFAEYSRRRGDFAIAGAAALIEPDAGGRCHRAAISVFGVASTPVRLASLEGQLVGQPLGHDPSSIELEVVAAAAADGLRPSADLHGDRTFRQEIAAAVIGRALRVALSRAAAHTQEATA